MDIILAHPYWTVFALVSFAFLIYLARRLQLRFRRPCGDCGSIWVERIHVVIPVENDPGVSIKAEGRKCYSFTFGECPCGCIARIKDGLVYLSGIHLFWAMRTQAFKQSKHGYLFEKTRTTIPKPLPPLGERRSFDKRASCPAPLSDAILPSRRRAPILGLLYQLRVSNQSHLKKRLQS